MLLWRERASSVCEREKERERESAKAYGIHTSPLAKDIRNEGLGAIGEWDEKEGTEQKEQNEKNVHSGAEAGAVVHWCTFVPWLWTVQRCGALWQWLVWWLL